ncbi:MAG: hypothetical protein ACREC4_02050 [Methylocella sp.]
MRKVSVGLMLALTLASGAVAAPGAMFRCEEGSFRLQEKAPKVRIHATVHGNGAFLTAARGSLSTLREGLYAIIFPPGTKFDGACRPGDWFVMSVF